METIQKPDAGRWLKRRDAWMRQLVSNSYVSRNAKLVGTYMALRMSAKRPFTYPAMKTIGKALEISPRHIARAMKELEVEEWVLVRRQPGRSSVYSLNL